jgi:prevent-host-death family protein
MPKIGVRELKDQATGILRQVREHQARYVITYHGEPVAALIPLDEGWFEGAERHALAAMQPGDTLVVEMDALRREIDRSWRVEAGGVELIAEGRR